MLDNYINFTKTKDKLSKSRFQCLMYCTMEGVPRKLHQNLSMIHPFYYISMGSVVQSSEPSKDVFKH